MAGMLAELGAYVFSADTIGRGLMQAGEVVYEQIVAQFGAGVVLAVGSVDRGALARIAFGEGRVQELKAIVHPATIARQNEMVGAIAVADAQAVVVVESALIFETKYGEGWRERFDRMVLVTAPEESKIARFVARSGSGDRVALEGEARRRLAQIIPDEQKAAECDFVVVNDGTIEELKVKVKWIWDELRS